MRTNSASASKRRKENKTEKWMKSREKMKPNVRVERVDRRDWRMEKQERS